MLATGLSYQATCNSILANWNAATFRTFMAFVYGGFSRQDPSESSTDYLELVELNAGGAALTVCGANPNGAGRVPCP
jgi:hypothetical protein